MSRKNTVSIPQLFIYGVFFLFNLSMLAHAEWNADWSVKNKITINPQALTGLAETVSVPVRLHSGNFDFTTTNIDGSDIRFVGADDKTELKFYIEKFDPLNELAVIWVQLPVGVAAGEAPHIWLYSGNQNATSTSDAKVIANAGTVGQFHFIKTALLQDSSPTGLVATGEVISQPAGLIGDSATLNGSPITVNANPAVTMTNGFTWSAWIKPNTLPQAANLIRIGESINLTIDQQTLKLKAANAEITGGAIKPAAWQHVAISLSTDKASVYLDGAEVATGAITLPANAGDIVIGDAFAGELDEMNIANVVRNSAQIKLAATSQGVDSKLLTVIASEGGAKEEEGEVNYIGILVSSLTIDAKVVIVILGIMFAISAWVMWSKAILVAKTDKDNKKFLARFQKASGKELLELDRGASYPNSNLYGLYQAGLREIKKREHNGELSLSGASMDAIKAAIDADLVRETQRQNAGMVLLTIAISGGPFLGLLGTVVGVMITFAAIAAAGDVNVNAIAPGIAAALLATVAGLAVAIPALFGYNYLASRIKNITIAMQIFVDEFVTRTAELFGK
jgi:biopolymer transport protein ExbB